MTDLLSSHLRTSRIVPLTPDEAVMTAATADTFPGCQLTLASICIRHSNVNLLVIDVGLTENQRAWLTRQGVDWIKPEADYLFKFDRESFAWNKCRLIALSPYRYTVWLDPCVIVTGDLGDAFLVTRKQPFLFTSTSFMPHEDRLYSSLPARHQPPASRRLPNTMVVGFNLLRDRHLLRDWQYCVGRAEESMDIRHMVWDCDKGALLWGLVNRNSCHLVRFISHFCQSEYAPPTTDPAKFFRTLGEGRGFTVRGFRGVSMPWAYWGVKENILPIDLVRD
jgi:hypothetical protein